MADTETAVTAPATDGTVESAALDIKKRMDEAAAAPPPKETPPPKEGAPEPKADAAPPEGEELENFLTGDADSGQEPGEGDAGRKPTIDAPAGWTADEKTWFETLEPARQESILRQYKTTQASEARRQNEHYAAMQQTEQVMRATTQERQQLQAALQNYADPLLAEYSRNFADVINGQIDPVVMARTDPVRYTEYQAYQDKFRQIDEHSQRLGQWQAQQEEQNLMQFRHAENGRLTELMPALKDPVKFARFDKDISEYLVSKGFQPMHIAKASAEELTIAYKAALYDRAVGKKPAAATQTGNAAAAPAPAQQRQAPRVMKPGTGTSNSGSDDEYAAMANKARRTGTVEDAAGMIRAQMKQRQGGRK